MPTFDDDFDQLRTGASSTPESDGADRDVDELATRLGAVERALSDGDTPVADLDDADAFEQRLTALETTVEDLTDRVAELEAASSALRGYAAGVRAVNEDVERRADLALAKAETIERSLREDSGLRVERLDDAIGDRQSAAVADESPPDAAERSSAAADDGRPPGADAEIGRAGEGDPRQAGERTGGDASDAAVAAAVGAPPETDGATADDAERRSLSSRLRDVL